MLKEFKSGYLQYQSQGDLPKQQLTLFHAARQARLASYSPYSSFKVGAAALFDDGTIQTGSNQQNAVYPLGVCAQTNLVARLGHLGRMPKMIAVVGAKQDTSKELCYPCGACRQTMMQLQDRKGSAIELMVCSMAGGATYFQSIRNIVPFAFDLKNLKH